MKKKKIIINGKVINNQEKEEEKTVSEEPKKETVSLGIMFLRIVGYILGTLFVFSGLYTLDGFAMILSILFGISLFHIIFELIRKSDFVENNEFLSKHWKLIRIALSVLLFIGLVYSLEKPNKEYSLNNDDNFIKEEQNNTEKNSVLAEKIKITNNPKTIMANDFEELKVEFTPSNATNRTITWKSSNNKIAEVDEDGTVWANGKGKVTITATTNNGVQTSIQLTVKQIDAKSLAITNCPKKMYKGAERQLKTKVTPSNASFKDYTWKSSNPSVATVNSLGKVEAKKDGKTVISAKTKNGKIAKCTIKVKGNDDYYHIGDTVKCPSFNITLNNFIIKKRGTRIDSFTYIDDPEWIGVILTVKNTSKSKLTYYTSNVQLQNTNGEMLSPNFWNYNIWGKNIPLLKSPTLIAGGKKKGYITFSNNNTNNKKLLLKVGCNDKILFEDTTFTFELVK